MRIEVLLDRLRKEFFKVNLIQSVIDGIILFLVINLGLFLFSIRLITGVPNAFPVLAVTFVFFVIDWYYRSRNYTLEIYEEKNPDLREKLRTARDSRDENSVVARALFDDVMDKTRKMTSETIIPTQRILQKIALIGVLSFLTVVSGMTGIQIEATSVELMSEEEFREAMPELDEEDEEFEYTSSEDHLDEREPINLSELQVDYEISGEGSRTEDEMSDPSSEDINVGYQEFSDEFHEDRGLALSYMREIRGLN